MKKNFKMSKGGNIREGMFFRKDHEVIGRKMGVFANLASELSVLEHTTKDVEIW